MTLALALAPTACDPRRVRPSPAWARVGLLAALAGGCPEPSVCTQAGCSWDPWIRIADDATADGRLRAGSYRFRLHSPHASAEWDCLVTVVDEPDPACDVAPTGAHGELDGEPVRWSIEASHDPGGLAITLIEIRDDGYIMTGPAQLSITVQRDGVTVAESTHAPEYVGRWVNGMECGPYCAAATEPVVVQLPAP